MARNSRKRLIGLLTAAAVIAAVWFGGAGLSHADSPASMSTAVTAAAKTPMQKTADCKAKDLTRRAMIACIAKAHVGVKENGAYAVQAWNCQRYFRDFGSSLNCDNDSSGPWCAAFTRWVWKTAGVPKSQIPASFAVNGWKSNLTRVTTPQVGDVAVNKTGSHILLVTAVSGSKITTIDGNGGYDDVRVKTHTKGTKYYYRLGT